MGQLKSIDKDIRVSEVQLREFKAVISQMDKINADKSKLIAKRNVIQNLTRNRLLYPVFFEDLLPIIPSDIWITGLTIKRDGARFQINFDSNALSNFALASWLTNLDQSKHFSQVSFGPIAYQKTADDRPPTLKFTLTCGYQHVGPYPLEGKK